MKKLFSEIPYLQTERITLRKVSQHDAAAVKELTEEAAVYRYLPTFLFEKKHDDISYMISHLYDECFRESIILGIYLDDAFCGLAEMYGYRKEIHKISVGYRLMGKYWGKGIATETLGLMVDYLYHEKDIEIITASTMIENHASARVLEKNGFELVAHAVPEDWGYESPTIVDKWVRKTPGSVFSVQ
jgi:ribosomal-protein-alanine N-acetyltransferase